ncbi:hypothetical protein [Pseudomonas sp. N040]|uniref:hypothetical protein n=1 Tax=Pseudomonas sp. N040 TaxID=2785325 RepID=UPI0018A321FC|nr:hypothetical protein [Pseudomonas sp. N040]MBF7728861.1 hypothetical protein [Pseudomonas sp. N040]MBW7012501.1 hypothetical protein [Pseudomonas sp. N040]
MPIRLLLLLCLSLPCMATELRVCADYRNVPPLSYIGGMGAAQYLLARAAQNLGIPLSISYRPQARCLLELADQRFDALLTVSPNPLTTPLVAFPLDSQGQIDTSRAYLRMRIVAFRMKGSQASWDGRQFVHLHKPVLFENGVPAVSLLMQRLPVASRSSARTPAQMIEMMRLGRAEIAVGLEPAIRFALRGHDPQGQFEILQPALLEAEMYLGISKSFAARHPEQAKRLWNEIWRINHSPEWLQIRDQVMRNQLAPSAVFSAQAVLAIQPPASAP